VPRRRRLRVFTPSGAGRRALDSVVHIQLIRLIIVVDDSTPHTHTHTHTHAAVPGLGLILTLGARLLAGDSQRRKTFLFATLFLIYM